MAPPNSMFMFEIVLEELKSFIDCRDYIIKSQFADIFTLLLREPVNIEVIKNKRPKKAKKTKSMKNKELIFIKDENEDVRRGQSVLFTSSIDTLMSHMMQYPLELSLWSKLHPECRLGSTLIPWNPAFVEYLVKLYKLEDTSPVNVNDYHNVFDEFTSKRMATIRINIKLICLKDKISSQFRSISDLPFINPVLNSNQLILKPIKEQPTLETGTIKTIYKGRKKNKTENKNKSSKKSKRMPKGNKRSSNSNLSELRKKELENFDANSRIDRSVSLVKSDTNLKHKTNQIDLLLTKSCSSITKDRLNALNYIFGDQRGPFGNKVYCVGYFTVENEPKSKVSIKASCAEINSPGEPKESFKYRLCMNDCPSKLSDGSLSVCTIDLPADAAPLINVTKCKNIECDSKRHKEPPPKPDDRILLDLKSLEVPCCKVTEEVVGEVKTKVTLGPDPCYCACECTFGFSKTTYCKICGGYEKGADEITGLPTYLMPPACPIYHKLVDKNKLKAVASTSGSETKRGETSIRSMKAGSKLSAEKKGDGKNAASESSKKCKKLRKDDRFKFNYGYKGIPPQIGHSQCCMPCSGTLNNVPKSMGWLWTAEDIPGMKFRPLWKPGAVNKFVLRLLRMAKDPGVVTKRRKDTTKKKRPLKRPLLVVHKKDGEFTVTMETMKQYTKPRALNQQPYEDKPVLTYTIGRTEEENRDRQKKKERVARRLERAQREFIQSTFRDMCQEICLKTYQQALGILPDAEDPECACYPAHPGAERTDLNRSCSCSEDNSTLGSDTDSDEWILEFTPPTANFDPTYKGKKIIKVDNESQYTYLDYRVKLLDRYGNPVPRFFKGQDGKQQCSDLGGFWSPDHVWLDINVDGYVAPDGRWAPMAFIGPSGEQVDCDNGKFQATNGKWLVVGVDGYIDGQNRWRSYPRPRVSPTSKKQQKAPTPKKTAGKGDKRDTKQPYPVSNTGSWSCFGDASPIDLSRMGIVGHGPDRKLLLKVLKDLIARGENVRLPQVSQVPRSPAKKRPKRRPGVFDSQSFISEQGKCRHPVPSDKGIVAVDSRGNKVYFKLRDKRNKRPRDRLKDLNEQGISLSTFHLPCFHSFIDGNILKEQQMERHYPGSESSAAARSMAEMKRNLVSVMKNKKHGSTQVE